VCVCVGPGGRALSGRVRTARACALACAALFLLPPCSRSLLARPRPTPPAPTRAPTPTVVPPGRAAAERRAHSARQAEQQPRRCGALCVRVCVLCVRQAWLCAARGGASVLATARCRHGMRAVMLQWRRQHTAACLAHNSQPSYTWHMHSHTRSHFNAPAPAPAPPLFDHATPPTQARAGRRSRLRRWHRSWRGAAASCSCCGASACAARRGVAGRCVPA
jgi:hypothetical protein